MPVVFGDPEFLASPEVGGHIRAVDNVFAGKTGDVRAGTPDVFPLNDCSLHPLLG